MHEFSLPYIIPVLVPPHTASTLLQNRSIASTVCSEFRKNTRALNRAGAAAPLGLPAAPPLHRRPRPDTAAQPRPPAPPAAHCCSGELGRGRRTEVEQSLLT